MHPFEITTPERNEAQLVFVLTKSLRNRFYAIHEVGTRGEVLRRLLERYVCAVEAETKDQV